MNTQPAVMTTYRRPAHKNRHEIRGETMEERRQGNGEVRGWLWVAKVISMVYMHEKYLTMLASFMSTWNKVELCERREPQ